MKKNKRLLIFLLVFSGIGLYFFLPPNEAFLSHSSVMEKIDDEYGVFQTFGNRQTLLDQKQTLLPHLRRKFIPFTYKIPCDLHKRVTLLQQPSNSLDQLRKDGEATQCRLKHFLHHFNNSFPKSTIHIPPTKPLHTINRLLLTRWDGDASRITDYARATIAFPTLEMMYEGLEQIKKSGLMILSIQDNFQTPCLGGYRDITVIFRDFVNGHIAELQLNTQEIMNFKEGLGTELFHIIRKLIAIPKLENRPLTENEKICLDTLFAMEKQGYEAAFESSREDKKVSSKPKAVGIYSGSFDPPTKAHQQIILKALETGDLDHLIVYVNQFGTKKYWASTEDRKKMLELMLKDHLDRVSVCIQKESDKRTDFRKLRGLDSHLVLLMGEDSFEKRQFLPPIQRAECDKIYVIPRRDSFISPLMKTNEEIKVMPLRDKMSISSTAARNSLFAGEVLENQLAIEVIDYIQSSGLYSEGKTDACAKR